MARKSERQVEAERLGLLDFSSVTQEEGNLAAGMLSSYQFVLSGHGDFTPITVRSSSILIDANLE